MAARLAVSNSKSADIVGDPVSKEGQADLAGYSASEAPPQAEANASESSTELPSTPQIVQKDAAHSSSPTAPAAAELVDREASFLKCLALNLLSFSVKLALAEASTLGQAMVEEQ